EDTDDDIFQQTSGDQSPFDRNLPTTHEYLGKLENISGYTIFDHGQIIELDAMCTKTMVFPGFTLPLVIQNSFSWEKQLKDGFIFVLTCYNNNKTSIFEYGVVMEVYETNDKNAESVHLKAKGRQRCRILPPIEVPVASMHRMRRVKVQIISDYNLYSPLISTQLNNLKRRATIEWKPENRKLRKYHAAQFNQASFVYDMYEEEYYKEKILDIIYQYFIKDNIPRDPLTLSYWFAQNFQLTHEERLNILAAGTTLERLRLELSFLRLKRNICCSRCGSYISELDKVFAMSKDGVQSNYCNPFGIVYETLTVTECENVSLEGYPSKKFTWFPGYYWTILKCKTCTGHLGWRFKSDKLSPPTFYGLGRSCVEIKIIDDMYVKKVFDELKAELENHNFSSLYIET
ncbi:PREDICTED: protein cereblon, partial [Nicrophorus vespilloides]|uniref:Protein cereblon n=1 Tax=Nicrophorus vespilloides TaxID=110193 RepID=A0ABM1MKF0_NICVS